MSTKAALERIGGDPSFARAFGALAARDDGRFDALATVARDTLSKGAKVRKRTD
ncbi:MAG: hypothetical protein ABSG03_11990 [Bryobacteraceae bacterium]|jgi:hypothetical protein